MRVLLFFLLLCSDAFRKSSIVPRRCNKLSDTYLDNDLINGLGIVAITVPQIIKQYNGNCNIDNDCPLMQRCCKVVDKKYCCNPNNYLNIDYAYNKQFMSYNTTKKIYF